MRTQCSLCHQGLNPLLSLVSLSCFTSTHVVFTLLSNPRKKMYNLKAGMLTTHSFPVTLVSCLSSLSSLLPFPFLDSFIPVPVILCAVQITFQTFSYLSNEFSLHSMVEDLNSIPRIPCQRIWNQNVVIE